MRKAFIIVIILILFIPFYLMCINYIAYEKLYVSQLEENNTIIGGTDVEVDMSSLVSVNVQRNRWYGTIYGQYGNNVSIENLYFFNLIKMPVKVNGANWMLYHIGVIGTLIFLIINILFIDFMLRKQRPHSGYKPLLIVN